MGIFRNPEIKKMAVSYLLFTAAAVLSSLAVGPLTSLCVLIVCIIAAAFFLFFTGRRYQKIADLSFRIDELLHGAADLCISPDQEGELAILSSEICKLTVCLREQADLLERDRAYLSSSLADISHQIRTPLTSVRLLLSDLMKEGASEKQKEASFREIGRLLSRIEWLITALLKISRLESGTVSFKKLSVSVRELIAQALEPLAVPLDLKGISVHLSIGSSVAYEGDFHWSVEAFSNLLKNCMEHTPEGGNMTVEASENPLYTEILIFDDGPGIAAEDLPHLFERFYKGKDSGSENAGIGLALSRMIIARQNGIITAENRKSGGAQFLIRFYKGVI